MADSAFNQSDNHSKAFTMNPLFCTSEVSPDEIHGVTGNISWTDPQIFLKASSAERNKSYLDIVDFINSTSDEKILLDSAHGQLVFRTGPPKPKLESVTVCQWSIANLEILNKLIETKDLKHEDMLDYLSYTFKVYQLLNTHDKTSVFQYDREYRSMQGQFGFRWGTDIPHLTTIFLRPKAPNKIKRTFYQNIKSKKPGVLRSKLNTKICKKYYCNARCSLEYCKSKHVCAAPGCELKHPATIHTENLQPKN